MSEIGINSSGVISPPEANADQRETRLWISGTLIAACFACSLTLINGKMQGLAAMTALRLFWLAIPTLGFNMLVGREPDRGRYRFGSLAWIIPCAGAVAAFAGISAFLYSFDRPTGMICCASSFLLLIFLTKTEEYAKERRRKAAAVEA